MNFPHDQVEELKALYGDVHRADEGGFSFILLKDVELPAGCTPAKSDLLLCPMPRDGYSSRLFFPQQIRSKTPRNWNGQIRILDRNWWAFSWSMNTPPTRLAEMVSTHLQGLR